MWKFSPLWSQQAADVEEVYFGENGVLSGSGVPKIFLDCSSIGVDQSSDIREALKKARS
jgi:3-hydroxyisobutyrate dehydrogenase